VIMNWENPRTDGVDGGPPPTSEGAE